MSVHGLGLVRAANWQAVGPFLLLVRVGVGASAERLGESLLVQSLCRGTEAE
jgi:hypothetical protein